MRELLDTLFSQHFTRAKKANRSGAWEEEIEICEGILALSPLNEEAARHIVEDEARRRIVLAQQHQQYRWMYENAGELIKDGELQGAKRLLKDLWQDDPLYGDPGRLARKAGFRIPPYLTGVRIIALISPVILEGLLILAFLYGVITSNSPLAGIGFLGGFMGGFMIMFFWEDWWYIWA